ncbi:MAG TPA: epoxide hydrolase [bacterium]|nr:epoxide hydrolase [bacterium]
MENSGYGDWRRHPGAGRPRDNTARLLWIYALALGICVPLAALAHAQGVSTIRDVRVTHSEGKNMTELKTLDATVEVPAPETVKGDTSIRPFRVRVSDEKLTDLRRRLAATRWPTKELVKDRSQGVQLATLKELARYWATEYDWRKAEAKLNALPQFVTNIDGVDIHFIHVKSRHPNAMPLIMTHGWPGSVIELLETVGPLTDPTSHGGTAGDAFHLVLPSLPGYGFSGEPTELGWESGRIARAWAELMRRLGYTRYVAQGGDVGASVTDAMGRQAPEGLIGIHLSLLAGALGIADQLPAKSEEERAAHKALATFRTSGFGYFLEQSTRPQTIGYSLLDSPVGLAAWLLDHDTDSYYKISRAFVDRKPVGHLTRETIVDNITLYWLTGTGASAARWYWEFGQVLAAAGAAGEAPPAVKVPVGFTTFPGEIWAAPRSWAETVYPGLTYFNQVDRGGHFAAWEEPALFASELRAAFKPLR